MYPDAPNPIQIQFAPLNEGEKCKPRLPPLILIHDSSGTTFNYFALGDLDRDVWAIHDPNYWEASAWEGGLDEMASHYVQLIEAVGISGPVVLGGRPSLLYLHKVHRKDKRYLACPKSMSLQNITCRLVFRWFCRNCHGPYVSSWDNLHCNHCFAID